MTSVDPTHMQKITDKMGNQEKVLEIVYLGETKDVLTYNFDKIKSKKMIAIGNINDFDWNLPCNFYLNENVLFEQKKTEEFVDITAKYIHEKKKDSWIDIEELFERVDGASKSL